jgi:hypothetical protein
MALAARNAYDEAKKGNRPEIERDLGVVRGIVAFRHEREGHNPKATPEEISKELKEKVESAPATSRLREWSTMSLCSSEELKAKFPKLRELDGVDLTTNQGLKKAWDLIGTGSSYNKYWEEVDPSKKVEEPKKKGK